MTSLWQSVLRTRRVPRLGTLTASPDRATPSYRRFGNWVNSPLCLQNSSDGTLWNFFPIGRSPICRQKSLFSHLTLCPCLSVGLGAHPSDLHSPISDLRSVTTRNFSKSPTHESETPPWGSPFRLPFSDLRSPISETRAWGPPFRLPFSDL